MTVGSHETSKEQFIASPPFPHNDSTSALVVPELWRRQEDVPYSEDYLVAVHITILLIVLDRKIQPFATKKNTQAFFISL